MNIDLYICVENLALNSLQKNNLVDAIFLLGQGYMYPAPIRKDNQAGIYEARFRSGDLLHYSWRNRLGAVFSVDPLSIDISENPVAYGKSSSTELIFSRLGIDYIRVILFGTTSGATITFLGKTQSAGECSAYLSLNTGAW